MPTKPKILYPACFERNKEFTLRYVSLSDIKRPLEYWWPDTLSFPLQSVFIAVSEAHEVKGANGVIGWAVRGTRKPENYVDPKYTEFVVYAGAVIIELNVKVAPSWWVEGNRPVYVYEWRGQLWVVACRNGASMNCFKNDDFIGTTLLPFDKSFYPYEIEPCQI